MPSFEKQNVLFVIKQSSPHPPACASFFKCCYSVSDKTSIKGIYVLCSVNAGKRMVIFLISACFALFFQAPVV